MKLFTTISLWCMALICSAQSDFSNDNEVFASINFNGRHCRGDRGICSIIIEENINKANTILSVKNDTLIELFVMRASLTASEIFKVSGVPNEEIHQENELYYTIDYPFTLSENLKTVLQINPLKATIKNDIYQITVSEDYFIITLKIE